LFDSAPCGPSMRLLVHTEYSVVAKEGIVSISVNILIVIFLLHIALLYFLIFNLKNYLTYSSGWGTVVLDKINWRLYGHSTTEKHL